MSGSLTPSSYCLGCPHPIYDDRRGEWDWYCRQHSPTGEALCRVLSGMHKIPADGIEAQILRW